MTTDDKRPDPRAVDPDIDAAWRALPRDEPPPALDAAIRAAARRAVGARPERVREATRPERWWWPLAAAATIGAVTIGILQLGGPDPRESMRSEPAAVSDMTPPSGSSAQKPAGPTAAPGAPAAEAPITQAPVPAAPIPAPMTATPVAPKPRDDAMRDATAPGATAPARKDAASAGTTTFAPAPPAAAPKAPAGRQSSANESRAQDAGRIERAPQESAAPLGVPGAPAANPFPAAPPSASPPPAMRRSEPATEVAAPSPAAESSSAPATAREREAFPVGGAAPADSRPSPKASALSAQQSPATMSTAEWIARIRRLRAEGRIEEAARELAAFRAAHPEHARELPEDLRDWHPPSAPQDAGAAPR